MEMKHMLTLLVYSSFIAAITADDLSSLVGSKVFIKFRDSTYLKDSDDGTPSTSSAVSSTETRDAFSEWLVTNDFRYGTSFKNVETGKYLKASKTECRTGPITGSGDGASWSKTAASGNYFGLKQFKRGMCCLASEGKVSAGSCNDLKAGVEILPTDMVLESSDCTTLQTLTVVDDARDIERSAHGCGQTMDVVNDAMENFDDFLKDAIDISKKCQKIADVITKVDKVVDLPVMGTFLNLIPKVGTSIKLIRKSLDKFKPVFMTVGNQRTKLEKIRKNVKETKNKYIVPTRNVVQGFENVASSMGNDFSTAITYSDENECCGEELIDDAATAFDAVFQPNTLTDAFDACAVDWDISSLKLSFPNIDLGVLDAIVSVLETIQEWIIEIVLDIIEEASEAICCNDVAMFFVELANTFADIFNLATCWVDGALGSVYGESLDVLMPKFQIIVDEFNSGIGIMNNIIDTINTAVQVPSIEGGAWPFLNVDTNVCSISFSGFVGELPTITTLSLNIDELDEIILPGDGTFDFENIGKAIVDQCHDSYNELKNGGDSNCCEIAKAKENLPEFTEPSCYVDSDCPDESYCASDGICTFVQINLVDYGPDCGAYCGSYAAEWCDIHGSCPTGAYCANPGPDGVCTFEYIGLNGGCTSHTDCPDYMSCLEGECEFNAMLPTSCVVDASCPSMATCVDGACKGPAKIGDYCEADFECESGNCFVWQCTAQSNNGHFCARHQECISGNCQKDVTGHQRTICAPDGYEESSVKIGEYCNSDSVCESELCQNRICVDKPCEKDYECRSGVCNDGICQLDTTFYLYEPEDATPTLKEIDESCSNNDECESGNCSGSTGMCIEKYADGEACTLSSQCQSGACADELLELSCVPQTYRLGQNCDNALMCGSLHCDDSEGKCAEKLTFGKACEYNDECESGVCYVNPYYGELNDYRNEKYCEMADGHLPWSVSDDNFVVPVFLVEFVRDGSIFYFDYDSTMTIISLQEELNEQADMSALDWFDLQMTYENTVINNKWNTIIDYGIQPGGKIVVSDKPDEFEEEDEECPPWKNC